MSIKVRTRTRNPSYSSTTLGACVGAFSPFPASATTYVPECKWEQVRDELGHKKDHTGKYIEGGGFYRRRAHIIKTPSDPMVVIANDTSRYTGQFIPNYLSERVVITQANAEFALNEGSSQGIKNLSYPRLYNSAKPGKAQADMAQFLAELRDIPTLPGRSLIKAIRYRRQVEVYRSMGSEYLNVVFGWLPFLEDLRKFVSLTLKLNAVIEQLIRDNGKFIRRRVDLPLGIVSSSTTSGNNNLGNHTQPQLHSVYVIPGGSYTHTIKEERFLSFSGMFRYWIPDIHTKGWRSRATRALYGINPTPATIWKIIPWTWLIDWHTNIGALLAQLDTGAADNLVCIYGYGMLNRVQTDRVDVSVKLLGGHLPSCQVEYKIEVMYRDAFGHYGFSAGPVSYSTKQALIIAALGLSNLRRQK